MIKKEAILGGVSNGGPAPGHRGRVNEDTPYASFEWFEQDKPHRINVEEAQEDLYNFAIEIAEQLKSMHIPDSGDKMTEKMVKNKLQNIYSFLKKIKNLSN